MTITKEQWQAIEKEIAVAGRVDVKFQYKGFELAVQRQRESESKTVLCLFIDGTIKPSWGWFEKECEDRPEIVKDVWKLTTKAKYKSKSIKELEKICGKRRTKKEFPDLRERYEYWLPYFSKSSVLCRQLKKLEGIKLIKAGCLSK